LKKTALVAVVFLSAVAIAFASGLSKKYKNWDRSPEAYFLTAAEKAQWKMVKTDDEAETFIKEYKSKRGPAFEKMLAERVTMADKYFSSGKTKGSETLRGKVVIVFGPPSMIEREKPAKSARADITRIDSYSSGGGGGPEMSSSGTAGPMSPHANAVHNPILTFSYEKEAAPKAIGKSFRVDLKMISDTEQEPDDPKSFDAEVEAVAQASLAPQELPKEEPPKEEPPKQQNP
jgi:GWxTD domain-containing protein